MARRVSGCERSVGGGEGSPPRYRINTVVRLKICDVFCVSVCVLCWCTRVCFERALVCVCVWASVCGTRVCENAQLLLPWWCDVWCAVTRFQSWRSAAARLINRAREGCGAAVRARYSAPSRPRLIIIVYNCYNIIIMIVAWKKCPSPRRLITNSNGTEPSSL